MMEWVLVICTQGWVMCGQLREVEYPSEEACYRALEDLYERKGPDAFKYVICKPAVEQVTGEAARRG